MAFEGGVLNTLGITPSFVSQTGTQAASGFGQVWKGSGQSFFGKAGQSLAGNLAGSAVNVALNSALGTQVTGPGGIQLNSGANILASTVTPFVTSNIAAGINQNIQQSLSKAGPFGKVLSGIGTSLVNKAAQSITDRIAGNITGAGNGNATNFKMFPGGGTGGEAPADYSGGNSYTLEDVVFSIQPANQGPQAFGDFSAAFDSKVGSKLPFGDLVNADFGIATPAVNVFKKELMIGDFSSTATAGFG